MPWLPGSGVGRRPHRGRDIGSLPASYLSITLCRTVSCMHIGASPPTDWPYDLGYANPRSIRLSAAVFSSALICSSLDSELRARRTNLLLIRLPLHIVNTAVNRIQLTAGVI